MKILSIDVGIKNLAYCLFDVESNKTFKIIGWDVLNLCGNEYKCSFKDYIKKNKSEKLCDRKATFMSNMNNSNKYICSTHLKKLYPDTISLKTIKKSKLNQLIEIAKQYNIILEQSLTKKQITDIIIKYIEDNLYHEISSVSANNIDLISIGISIRDVLNKSLDMNQIDKVIIENQISPIANRMKSIQGMLSQYFIMNNKPDIHFISSANKLKYFLKGRKTEYSERKKLSMEITGIILESQHFLDNLSNFNNHKKKDDLADSFLQGLWYLVHNSFIYIDNDIILSKINT